MDITGLLKVRHFLYPCLIIKSRNVFGFYEVKKNYE